MFCFEKQLLEECKIWLVIASKGEEQLDCAFPDSISIKSVSCAQDLLSQ